MATITPQQKQAIAQGNALSYTAPPTMNNIYGSVQKTGTKSITPVVTPKIIQPKKSVIPTATKSTVVTPKTNATTTPTAPTAVTTPSPITTPIDNYGQESEYERQARLQAEQAQLEANQNIDENSIRRQKLNDIQAQIDAVNAVYAEKLNQARMGGEGRLGSTAAIQGRRGLLGSDFGASQTEAINQGNREEQALIGQENMMAVLALQSKASQDAIDEIAAKRQAKAAGLQTYLGYLSGAEERADKKAKEAAQMLVSGNTDINTVPQAVKDSLKKSGINFDKVTLEYNLLKKAQEEASAKAAQEGQFKLGEGDALYDAQGNIIASRAKTYKPGSGGSGGGKLLSPTEAMALGVPYGTTEAGAYGLYPTKPATAAQELTAGYALRVTQANNVFDSTEKSLTKKTAAGQKISRNLPTFLNKGDVQAQKQAERNFINAVLRRESGAAIARDEYKSAQAQYFPAPGDTKQVLEQKRNNRILVQNQLARSSGSAYDESLIPQPIAPPTGKTSSGIGYTIEQ